MRNATRVRDVGTPPTGGDQHQDPGHGGARPRELPELLSEVRWTGFGRNLRKPGRVGSGIPMTGGVQLMRDVFNDERRH